MKSVFVAVVFAALVALSCSQKCEKSQIACQGVDGKCVGDFITMGEACVGTAQCCKYPFHCINGLCKEDSTVCGSTSPLLYVSCVCFSEVCADGCV